MATSKMFVHYSGTIDQFKALSNIAEYNNKIVFIKGGNDGKGAAIYTHGEYYTTAHDIEAAVASLKIIKGVQVNSDASTIKTATDHNGIINFTNGDETVAISAEGPGITISVSESFQNRVSAIETTIDGLKGTGTGSVSDQITSAVNALKGTLDDTDATTLEAINDELDAIQTNYIAKSDLATEASDNDGVNVKVTVKTKDGKVSDVVVDESVLNVALNSKANADDVYDKTGAENMAQDKVNALANGAVKTNADAIAELKGNASQEGSIAKQIQDAINAFAGSADADNVIENVTELLNYVSGVDGSKTLANAIAQIEENKGKIATLNGDASTANSVAKTVADAKEEILGVITENERVISEAYTNLDGRVIALEGKNATIDSALQEIVAVGSDYITLTDSDKTNNTQTITASVAVKAVSDATASKQGLADAYDVNQEIAAAKAYAASLFDWEEL